jgi:hypothetical protein
MHLQALAREDDGDADSRHGHKDEQEERDGVSECRRVASLEGIEEPARPMVERDGRCRAEQEAGGKRDRQDPGTTRAVAAHENAEGVSEILPEM